MRLIDADELDVEIRKLAEKLREYNEIVLANGILRATTRIRSASTIDPVHAAGGCYCRECKYADPFPPRTGPTSYFCRHKRNSFRLLDPERKPNDFCSNGERKVTGDGLC